MNAYPVSNNENERLQELFSYHILDSAAEKEFDDLVQIAASVLNAPVAAITFMDASRQWIKAQTGLNFCEVDRKISVCNYTIMQDQLLEVEDLTQDERFSQLPYVVHDPSCRYYAGMPLITSNGFKIGVFYIIDTVPRKLDDDGYKTLTMLSSQAMKQLELRLKNIELENLNAKQRQISGILSHDIKRPLSNIKTILDMQCSEHNQPLDEEAKCLNHMLVKQVNNTIGMLDNMIRWSKLQLQNSEDKMQYANLRQLADEVIEETGLNTNAKQNTLVNDIPAQVNAMVDCEGVRFALRNLLTNAGKFTAHGFISISYEEKDGKAYIHVSDTGVGMSKEQTAKLNTNKQVSFSYGTNNEKGNGLGLGLLYDYLAQQGNQLLFQSEAGRGTKASFTV